MNVIEAKPTKHDWQDADYLADRLYAEQATLQAITEQLSLCLQAVFTDENNDMIPSPYLATYVINQDPYDQSFSLSGTWLDTNGYRCGEIQIRADGGIYAEVDVVRNHPTDPRWFIEAVTAWGNKQAIKTELRLLATV